MRQTLGDQGSVGSYSPPASLGADHPRPSARAWTPNRLATYYRLAAAILDDAAAAEPVAARAFDSVWQSRRAFGNVVAFETALLREMLVGCRVHAAAKAAPRAPRGVDISDAEAEAWNIRAEAVPRAAEQPAAPAEHAAGQADPPTPDSGSFETALASLTVDERAVLVLAYATDMTVPAIATAMAVSEDRVHRALSRIEAQLSRALDADPSRAARLGRPIALRDEIRRSLHLPPSAPPALIYHAESQQNLTRIGGPRRPRSRIRLRFAIPIALALVSIAFVGSGTWRAVADIVPAPPLAASELPGHVDGFGRVDARTAWAFAGDTLYITADAGATWTKGTLPAHGPAGSYVPTISPPRYMPFFVDAAHGWLLSWKGAGSGGGAPFQLTVHRTTDGGRKWTSYEVAGTWPGFGSIQFVDDRHGWIVVNSLENLLPTVGTLGVQSLQPLPGNTLTVLATSDGGRSWSQQSSLPAAGPIRFVSATEGWGELATSRGGGATVIVHTTDGGKTWTDTAIPAPADCTSAPAARVPAARGTSLDLTLPCLEAAGAALTRPGLWLSATVQQAAGHLVTLASPDDGKTWQASPEVDGPLLAQFSPTLSLARMDPQQPLLGSRYGSLGPLVTYGLQATEHDDLVASFDDGNTWDPVSLPAGVALADIQFAGPNDVWVMLAGVGSSWWLGGGEMYASRDGGTTWRALLGARDLSTASPSPAGTGPVVPKTTDAPFQTAPLPGGSLIDFGRIDAHSGWARTDDALYLYRSGTWSGPVQVPGGPLQAVTDRDLIVKTDGILNDSRSVDTGWVAQLLVFMTSSDGGKSWRAHPLPFDRPVGTDSHTLFHFVAPESGRWFFSYTPSGDPSRSTGPCRAYTTGDSGATWTSSSAPCFEEMHFINDLVGWGREYLESGADANAAPRLLITRDGGSTWSQVDTLHSGEPGAQLAIAQRKDGSLDLASWTTAGTNAGNVEFLRSTDARTWTHLGTSAPSLALVVPSGEGRWLGLGVQSAPGDPVPLWRSTDGGTGWTQVSLPVADGVITSGTGGADGTAWLAIAPADCAADGQSSCPPTWIVATSDAGDSWSEVWPATASTITSSLGPRRASRT